MYVTLITDEGLFEGELKYMHYEGNQLTLVFANGDPVEVNRLDIQFFSVTY